MQRIDESTYIDDTLVTCAEYQLFIDDMRAQGKYFQPDHWTSYQFPKGKAKEPILGVRFRDAKSFCEWVSKREAGVWQYRLSTDVEAVKFQLRKSLFPKIGYWTTSAIPAGPEYRFSWDRIFLAESSKKPDLFRVNLSSFSQIHTIVLGVTDILNLVYDRKLDFHNELPHAISLNFSLAKVLGLERELDLAYDLARTIYLDLDLDRYVASVLKANFDGVAKSAKNVSDHQNYFVDIDFDIDLYTISAFIVLDRNFKHKFDLFRFLFTDFINLQERLAGRSPAFEGIRLVKERTR